MPLLRTPWPDHFPDVFVFSTETARNIHPCYSPAKAGNADAAISVSLSLMADVDIDRLGQTIKNKDKTKIVAVSALEFQGYNAIPDAMGVVLEHLLKIPFYKKKIFQNTYVGHTRANAFHRLATPATFIGPVQAGLDYILVDDHVGMGGTLANLKGYIELHGGIVISMATLSETRDAGKIALRPETLNMLQSTYGKNLEKFCYETFGHTPNCFTEIEARRLIRVGNLDEIRSRVIEAAGLARAQGIQAVQISDSGNQSLD